MHDKLNEMGYLNTDGTVKSDKIGIPITLEFPFTLHLNGINKDVNDERMDSASIINAMFTSVIKNQALPLHEEWVSNVQFYLGDEFHRPEGKIVDICKPGDFHYNANVPITIDRFILDLMKIHNPSDYYHYKGNAKDTCHITIKFTFTIPAGTPTFTIPSNAAYLYDLQIKFIDYEAIWGFFRPSADMRDESIVIIEDEWSKWSAFKKATLPFHDPRVNVMIGHTITGIMNMHGEYLYAKNFETNDSIFAYFNAPRTDINRLVVFDKSDQYLPLTSTIGDSIHNQVLFDKDIERGQIDKMFVIKPDALGYKFFIDFDSIRTPQIRVLPDTRMKVKADLLAAFMFNKGVEACYTDTAKDVNISKYSLDSLIADVEFIDTIKASNVKLILTAENRIPLTIRGTVRFYDENMNLVMDPMNPSKPLLISNLDTLIFNAPEFEFSQGTTHLSEPGKSVYTLDLEKKHFDSLTKIKHIRYYAELDGKDLDKYYDQDSKFLIKLTAEDKLKIKLGITANADAVFNFGGKEEQK